jgi:hypothetical protein
MNQKTSDDDSIISYEYLKMANGIGRASDTITRFKMQMKKSANNLEEDGEKLYFHNRKIVQTFKSRDIQILNTFFLNVRTS